MSRPWGSFRSAGVVTVLLVVLSACASSRRLAYTPDELRAEVARRSPELDPEEVVVPFEVLPEHVALARRAVMGFGSGSGEIQALSQALLDPGRFGLRYAPAETATALETLRNYEGNCLSLASVFVGLARGLGYRAFYIDASARVSELSTSEPALVVNEGHITAAVEVGGRLWYADFDHSIGALAGFRPLDDLELLAHFYNNRGYERTELARARGEKVDWAAAASDFALATRVAPGLARAWNNLGVAEGRLGRRAEAELAFRRAISEDGTLAGPRNNLGALYLSQGRPEEAVAALEGAVQLEPKAAHSQYNLARALLLTGDLERGREALERAAVLENLEAGRMLGKLELYERVLARGRD